MDRFQAAIARLDAASSEDPNRERVEGVERPKELVYAQRMTRWIERLVPDASEALRLAVRCQHLRRWTLPRDRYPMDGAGYKRWRTTLARMHAETAGEILRQVGYSAEEVGRVQALVRKQGLASDPEAQALEDAACLVFLESGLAEFSTRQPREKVIDILRKTWVKMSERARAAALELPVSSEARALVQAALG